MVIELVIGAGAWGQAGTPGEEAEFMTAMKEHKSVIKTIDTAALYPFSAPGASERFIGKAGFGQEGYLINTKALFSPEGGCFTRDRVQSSVDKSLESLEIPKVNILYAHAPDRRTPILEQAIAFNEQYEKGRCDSVGVANLGPEMLQDWIAVAEEKGYVKPIVYQGQYNILCRAHEEGIFPVVRENGMKFMAYSPLAGGFLTGKPTFSAPSDLVGTRFEHTDSNSTHGPFYRMWYNKESMHEAVKTLKASADLFDISMTEIAIRWLTHHSALRDGDGIIVGPETVDELDDCVRAYRAGPLPEDLVKVIEELQNTVSTDAESIVRL